MVLSLIKSVLSSDPPFRLKQVEEAIFKNLIESWDEAKNLPAPLREKLKKECPLEINSILKVSKDNSTAKALITLEDGCKIETVLMKHIPSKSSPQENTGESAQTSNPNNQSLNNSGTDSGKEKDSSQSPRNSICVSTQVGCPMGCAFCATGKLGLIRNLTTDEILEQVLFFARYLKKEKSIAQNPKNHTTSKEQHRTSNEKITNITFIGMGEPFLNYDNVIAAIKKLNEKHTLNLGARRFSISTCGVIEGITRLMDEKLEVNLAISLHAPNDTLRTQIMPSNRKYPLAKILGAVDNYYNRTHRKIMFEYIMLKGVNDSEEQAEELAKILKGKNCVVNLIPYNPTFAKNTAKRQSETNTTLTNLQSTTTQNPKPSITNQLPIFQQTSHNQIRRFKEILISHGIQAVQRWQFGQDIDAACGQLAAKNN